MKDERDSFSSGSFGELLKRFRKRQGVQQHTLAVRLDVHRNTVGVWERGDCLPGSKTTVLEIARQLLLGENETRQLLEASLTALAPYWHVPYQRSPFFTGREHVLAHLHTVLTQEPPTLSAFPVQDQPILCEPSSTRSSTSCIP